VSRKVSKVNRQARREQLEQEKKRRNMIIGGGTTVVVVLIAALVIFRIISSNIEGVINLGSQAQGHDQEVEIAFTSLPPVGGIHDPAWQNCGIYTEPVEVKHAIHSMEHGAVWITYQPDLPAEDVSALQEIVQGQTYLLLSPYPNLASDIVLTAWGVQLEVDSVDDERIEQFVSQYRIGPQTPEPGASCSGRIGTPLS
jgi:hypothetical protein